MPTRRWTGAALESASTFSFPSRSDRVSSRPFAGPAFRSMLKLRRLHLYLGVFFSPMLLFFLVTGWYQTAYPDRRKSVFEASAVMDRLRAVHADQTFPVASA